MLDLFPDAYDKVNLALKHSDIHTHYPVSEFIVVFGFLVIFLVEQLILTSNQNQLGSENEPLLSHESFDSVSSYGASDGLSTPPARRSTSPPLCINHEVDECDDQVPDTDIVEENQKDIYVDPNSHSVVRSLILVLALSLHSVFEGLAIGLQPTTQSVLAIFLPVALHKSILAFALGMNLTLSKLSVKSIIRSNLTFSVTSPIGIFIGLMIVDFAPASNRTDIMNGVMQSVACGTFLFVVFFEILPHEFMGRRHYPHRLLKTLALVLGYATVALLLFLDEDAATPTPVVSPTAKP